ncbi:MAG TPA: LysR family transcriptional regulator [Phototrophicaceae bacterium]|nr:LysR family transcriptional regulator [Phototrophicaceae bacterium]
MNFSQLELIRAIHEKGSISTAAETVGLTQSAASRALSSLEDELEVTLVNRTHSGGVLTESGKHLLPHIYEILAHAEYIRQDTAARRGLAVGKLRIGSVPSMSARLLSQLIAVYHHRYPGIETVVFEGHEAEIATWLQQGIVDVGLISHAAPSDNVFTIARDELKIVVPTTHRLARGSSVPIRELANEPFVMSKTGCLRLLQALFQEEGQPFLLQYELSDVNTVLEMVKEGLGISMIPAMSLPDDLDKLHPLSFSPPIYRYLHIAVNNLATASPAARAFIDIATNCNSGVAGLLQKAEVERQRQPA